MANKLKHKNKPVNKSSNSNRVAADFKNLSYKELTALERKWNRIVMQLEFKLETALRSNNDKEARHCSEAANKFWRRLKALERFVTKLV